MVHLFLNCDEYLATQAIATLRAAISDNAELADLNYAEHEGERLRAVDLLGEADMMPFLTERRMIRVNGYFTHLSKRLKPKRKASDEEAIVDDDEDAADDTPASARAEAEAILNGLADAPDTCDLIFFDPVRQTDRGAANSVDLGGTMLGKGSKADAKTWRKGCAVDTRFGEAAEGGAASPAVGECRPQAWRFGGVDCEAWAGAHAEGQD